MSISKINIDGTEHGLIASSLTDTSTEKVKLNYTNVAYGTCSTAAETVAKVISVSGNTNWALTAGSIITVKFSYTNTASSPTFNVNSTGAKSVWYNTALITTSNKGYAGTANRPSIYMYDGTQYVFLGWAYDANSTYSNLSLGQGYSTCSTAAATTAKTVTLSSYTLTTGGIVSIKFTYDVPASATLNINSKGAKSIYHKGAAIAAGIIKAGDTATFIYNGSQYHLISLDRDTNTTYSAATTSTAGLVKPKAVRTSAITATTGGTTSGRYYGVELDSNGSMFVNVPWTSGSGGTTSSANGYHFTASGDMYDCDFLEWTQSPADSFPYMVAGDIFFVTFPDGAAIEPYDHSEFEFNINSDYYMQLQSYVNAAEQETVAFLVTSSVGVVDTNTGACRALKFASDPTAAV